jgi:hypothetical protein
MPQLSLLTVNSEVITTQLRGLIVVLPSFPGVPSVKLPLRGGILIFRRFPQFENLAKYSNRIDFWILY